MKKISTIALLLLMVAMVFAMTACNDPSDKTGAGEIFIEESGMPQLEHVVGEELDLSNGLLTVKTGEEVKQIPLNDEGISITGYDKNTLGEQTLTITYNGMSTQLKVTTVARMQMIEHITDYLVGDSLDMGVGRLKITRNDGSNYTVLLNGTGVEITGFDPNKAGTQTLTAKYTGTDAAYECQFAVNVHTVDKVEFQAPKKVNYNSHDAGIDLTDGYFILTGNGGALIKKVVLTEEMVSGFDLSAVTEENTPFSQKLTASYGSNSYDFEIKLTYTDISMFKKEAAAFAGLDWTGEEIPEYSAELGELALKLMEAYLDLSKADRTYITSEESLSVARVALLYGMEKMDADFVALEGAFIIDAGSLEFTCISPEAVKTAIEILENDDSEIYRISPIIVDMVEVFGEEEVMPGMYFGEFNLLPNEVYEQLLEIFEHMLDVQEAFAVIPEDWRSVGVDTYAAEIQDVFEVIFTSDYGNAEMGYIYDHVAAWRPAGDAFDILYHYYYGQNDMEAMKSLAKVSLPGALDEVAENALLMMEQVDLISNYAQADTTLLMYYYNRAIELADAIKNGDDVMLKNLYDTLPVNYVMGLDDSDLFSFDILLEHIRTMEGGYYQYSGGMLGVDAYHAIMDCYMELVTKLMSDVDMEYETSEQYGQDLEALFAMFVELRPTQQYYFLNTLNAFYSISTPPLAFDDSGDYAALTCFFVNLVNEYYREKLSDDAVSAYNDLVIAIEIYAQRASYENWLGEFTGRMDNVKAVYDMMNAEDKAAFDKYLRFAYSKYATIRQRFVESTEYTNLGEWADEFAALEEAILNVEIAAAYMQQGSTAYNLFFTAYEKAMTLEKYILENAPQEILDVYYFEDRSGLDENGEIPEGVQPMSYEYQMTTYRTMYINYLLTAMGYSIYDVYTESNLGLFMEQAYDLIWTYMYNTDENPLTYDKAQVLGVMDSFRKMELIEQVMFVLLEGEGGCYYLALDEFLTVNYSAEVYNAALKLLELEQQYILYAYNAEDEATLTQILPAMQTLLNEMVSIYEALSDADKAAFADFKEIYDYYVNLCNQALAPAA